MHARSATRWEATTLPAARVLQWEKFSSLTVLHSLFFLEVLLSCWKTVRHVLRRYKCIIVPQNRLKMISWAEIAYRLKLVSNSYIIHSENVLIFIKTCLLKVIYSLCLSRWPWFNRTAWNRWRKRSIRTRWFTWTSWPEGRAGISRSHWTSRAIWACWITSKLCHVTDIVICLAQWDSIPVLVLLIQSLECLDSCSSRNILC